MNDRERALGEAMCALSDGARDALPLFVTLVSAAMVEHGSTSVVEAMGFLVRFPWALDAVIHGQEDVCEAYRAGYKVGRAGREPQDWEGP